MKKEKITANLWYYAIFAVIVVMAVVFVKPLYRALFHSDSKAEAVTRSYLPTSGFVLNMKARDLEAAVRSMRDENDEDMFITSGTLNLSNGFTISSARESVNGEFKSIVNPNNLIDSIAPEEGFIFKDGKKPSLTIPQSEYKGCVKVPAWIVLYLIENGQFQEDPNYSIEE